MLQHLISTKNYSKISIHCMIYLFQASKSADTNSFRVQLKGPKSPIESYTIFLSYFSYYAHWLSFSPPVVHALYCTCFCCIHVHYTRCYCIHMHTIHMSFNTHAYTRCIHTVHTLLLLTRAHTRCIHMHTIQTLLLLTRALHIFTYIHTHSAQWLTVSEHTNNINLLCIFQVRSRNRPKK